MKKDISYYKEKLEAEKAALLSDLGSVGKIKDAGKPDEWEAKPDNPEDVQKSDSNEVGDFIESFEENSGIESELQKRLTEIDAALEKIKNGNFGLCEIGKEPIEDERLEANPAARTCKKHINS
jgi:RNA polymerase-binding transcription factor DksA